MNRGHYNSEFEGWRLAAIWLRNDVMNNNFLNKKKIGIDAGSARSLCFAMLRHEHVRQQLVSDAVQHDADPARGLQVNPTL